MKASFSVLAFSSLILFLTSCAIEGPPPTPTANPVPPPSAQEEPTRAPTVVPEANADAPTQSSVKKIPVYRGTDFLSNYLTHRTYPILFDAKPWINSSLNVVQYRDEMGGTTFWDFWGPDEAWETPHHQWQDDAGVWHEYHRTHIKTRDGRDLSAYVLVDRPGPGVMDLLYFVHDTVIWRGDVLQHLRILGTRGVEDIAEWGNLHRLGTLRIVVDDKIVFDGAIKDWFSGKAQQLTPDLAKTFVWRFQDFGSNGNIIPIPYQNRLQIFLYGGQDKPKWFMATGITLPRETRVSNVIVRDDLQRLARNVLEPDKYIEQFEGIDRADLRVQAGAPARLAFDGSGTIEALHFRVAKNHDPRRLGLRVRYRDEIGMDVPLLAFFSEPEVVSLHRSSPIGAMDVGDAYLFYSNLPLPFHEGITLELTTTSTTAVPVSARLARSGEIHNTRLRIAYNPGERLRAFSPDYRVRLDGDGKLVGIVLVTRDQDFRGAPTRKKPGTDENDPATHTWPMGYLEANLILRDGAGNSRIYSGHEDWAGAGYFFNIGYTTPSGGSNRPFGGILRYKDGENGYATIFRYFSDLSAFRFKNGLTLSFGHGTWKNNFPVTFGSTIFYYQQLGGLLGIDLPASEYVDKK